MVHLYMVYIASDCVFTQCVVVGLRAGLGAVGWIGWILMRCLYGGYTWCSHNAITCCIYAKITMNHYVYAIM